MSLFLKKMQSEHQMAIAPIDLQTLYTQLDKIGKTQGSQAHNMQVQSVLQDAEKAKQQLEEHKKISSATMPDENDTQSKEEGGPGAGPVCNGAHDGRQQHKESHSGIAKDLVIVKEAQQQPHHRPEAHPVLDIIFGGCRIGIHGILIQVQNRGILFLGILELGIGENGFRVCNGGGLAFHQNQGVCHIVQNGGKGLICHDRIIPLLHHDLCRGTDMVVDRGLGQAGTQKKQGHRQKYGDQKCGTVPEKCRN